MILLDAVIALSLAVVLGFMFSALLGLRSPWSARWALFLVLFLFIWAGGVWMAPAGPLLYGVPWVPYLLIGLMLLLVLAAAADRREPRTHGEAIAQEEAEHRAALGLNVFFWLLIVVLSAMIFFRYL